MNGYTNVNPNTLYSAALGYGFDSSAGITASPVSGKGTLTSNFIDTQSSAFRADVANGTYNVYITLGDNSAGRTDMYYYEQGVRRGVVTTLAGQHVMIMNRVEVTDGHLDVQVFGGESNVALNAISLVQVSTYTTPANGPSYAAGRYYVAMENLTTGNVMRMQVDLQAGGSLCPQGVLLAPNTPYREYVYNVNHNTVGYSDFVTSASGTFLLPNIVMGQHLTGDIDGDGLENLAEFIIGTNSQQGRHQRRRHQRPYVAETRHRSDRRHGAADGVVGSQT